jgi:tRNA threonylcarbamoyladenosine biosynthesis protein TsaB
MEIATRLSWEASGKKFLVVSLIMDDAQSNKMLLAIDTSTRTLGVALYDGAHVIGELVWTSANHHTVELAPAVAEAFRRAGVSAQNLVAVGVATGPGSFTGLRIGMALAKGIALARHLPVIGVPTLDVLAAAQPVREMDLAAVLLAGRGRLATGWYRVVDGAWHSTGEMIVLTAEEMAHRIQRPTLVCGELSAEERRLLSRKRKNVMLASPAQSLRRPSFLAELAWQRWQAGQMDNPASLAPQYLHYKEAIPG